MSRQQNPLGDKSFHFAIRVIALQKQLVSNHKEFILSRQLARSGTSVGAMIRESQYASSRADFIHKLTLALKEANETEYWLDLLAASEYLEPGVHSDMTSLCKELMRMLITSIKTSKDKL